MTFSQSSLSNSISAPHIPLPQHLTCWDLTLPPPWTMIFCTRPRRGHSSITTFPLFYPSRHYGLLIILNPFVLSQSLSLIPEHRRPSTKHGGRAKARARVLSVGLGPLHCTSVEQRSR